MMILNLDPRDLVALALLCLVQNLRLFEFPRGKRNFVVSTSNEIHWAVAEVRGLVW
jgi:hypothetical protein